MTKIGPGSTLLGGRLQIKELIGKGAFRSVYRALILDPDTQQATEVVVKLHQYDSVKSSEGASNDF